MKVLFRCLEDVSFLVHFFHALYNYQAAFLMKERKHCVLLNLMIDIVFSIESET